MQLNLNDREQIVVLAPNASDRSTAATGPVAVIGWIVDSPAEQVSGYLGDAAHAIWAGRVISL